MAIIAAIAALCIGILIGMYLFQDRPVGDLRVDHSDFADEGPIYILSWIRIYEPLCGRNGWSSGSRWRTSCRTNDIGLYGGVL